MLPLLLFLILTIRAKLVESGKPPPGQLEWGNCTDFAAERNECAVLTVPLDYTDSESDSTLALDLLKVNATKTPVLGSVLYNPGGPGGSGVEAVGLYGTNLVEILGGQYNVIGFDPRRGTGKTIPFDCKNTMLPIRRRRDLVFQRNLTELLLEDGWDSAQRAAAACSETMKETGELIGTAFVARDMVQIIDALEEDGQLRYWGMSYGTQLGMTFASMFPDRVERLILDGVTNPHEYVAGTWFDSLHDTDKAFLALLSECLKAGDKCELSNLGGPKATAEDLLKKIDAKLKGYYIDGKEAGGSLYSYLLMKLAVHQALYSPNQWAMLSSLLMSIMDQDFESELPDEPITPPPIEYYNLGYDAPLGIACGDSTLRVDSPKELLDIVAQQEKVSSFGDIWFTERWKCTAWPFKAKDRYTGNFSATTNFPILFIGNSFDPVTPLSSAHNASAGFADSVVLNHNGYGHCSIAHPSLCTGKAVRSYFVDGKLPEPGTKCEPDIPAFDLGSDDIFLGEKKRSTLSDDDVNLLKAMKEAGRLRATHSLGT
ncbi:hypothetical protein AJ80_02816 [Polytolypa hystricis UAMH7299]|uniref:AB hydrolase-1 domain-containing protein n=1 Tax=Polytolypa hystricis (strain UAMH7299) TaxID=1447883 RepID=A0A2B7YPY4_POLH7|nr:hypothetical protein AJ80_02816 [Polytolypa hystricis UAMH7299]